MRTLVFPWIGDFRADGVLQIVNKYTYTDIYIQIIYIYILYMYIYIYVYIYGEQWELVSGRSQVKTLGVKAWASAVALRQDLTFSHQDLSPSTRVSLANIECTVPPRPQTSTHGHESLRQKIEAQNNDSHREDLLPSTRCRAGLSQQELCKTCVECVSDF